MQTIGEKISALRKQRKMTQDELAEKMGVSSQAVSKWETNMSIPDLPSLINLADFFGITLDERSGTGNQTCGWCRRNSAGTSTKCSCGSTSTRCRGTLSR